MNVRMSSTTNWKYTYIFNQQNVSNSEIVHLRMYVYFWSILRIIQCMRAFRIWDLTENTHTEKMDTFWMLKILNSENWLKIHIHSKSTWSFGPLSSFGPVMVIRTPIRKDPRADSLCMLSLSRTRAIDRVSEAGFQPARDPKKTVSCPSWRDG